MRRSGSREVMRQGLVDQDDWDVDGVQHFQRDRAQQQAPRRPEASRSHDDVVALMLGSMTPALSNAVFASPSAVLASSS
ncbi:hypothetical protein G6F57_023255 [Rhizopus arrhizus]|nr:hypothetical protein G6F35_017732 [Rhizopus arrhizus]KAG1427440.1 hypothetical protein G6F57_023255 [Rhizopus arrhizus]